jgi:hypothetical protein
VARKNRRRRTPGLTALLVALVSGALGVGLIAWGAAHPLRVAEKRTQALIVSVHNCYKETCGYNISYIDGSGNLTNATIPGPQNEEPGAGSSVTIYYQVSHPTEARFSNTAYANDTSNELIAFGVILILIALVSVLVGAMRLAAAVLRARRAARVAAPAGPG